MLSLTHVSQYGTCVPIDLVEFEDFRAGGIFRCPATFYAKFRAALTLTGEFEERICCLNVSKVSRNLSDLTTKVIPPVH